MDMSFALPHIRISSLTKSFAIEPPIAIANPPVLDNLSLTLGQGEIIALIGRSGCGKTTLLHCLAGLLSPDQGVISPIGVSERCAVVFQDHRLLPWATLEANLLLALRNRSDLTRADKQDMVMAMLEALGLIAFASNKPDALSGGMAQRAALGRALLQEPDLLLLDEPFASLDAFTRMEMHDLLLVLHRATPRTTLFVTHDLEEAVKLADRVVVMAEGRIVQDCPISSPRPRDLDGSAMRNLQRQLRALVTERPALDCPSQSSNHVPGDLQL